MLIVHMGGELASVLGRLEFTWRLNYNLLLNHMCLGLRRLSRAVE